MLLVGIDIGGTFTDLALYDSDREHVEVHKVRSTPEDPGRALVSGIVELCEQAGVATLDLDDPRDKRRPGSSGVERTL